MTALKQYERLESEGLWRADKDAQRRDVLVSFGNATLVISDSVGRPLTHWSLPAISRLNEGERPALFSTDEAGDETLEIADALMIDAIEKVRKTLLRAQPHPGRLRNVIVGTLLVLSVLLGVFWFPQAAEKQTLSVVPQSKRLEIGSAILTSLEARTGTRCTSKQGQIALSQLSKRLFGPDSKHNIIVLPRGVQSVRMLPGQIVLIGKSTLTQFDDPNVVAGQILVTQTPSNNTDPLADVLSSTGINATLRLLTTGEIEPDLLDGFAAQIFDEAKEYTLDETFVPTFDLASVPIAPFIEASERSGTFNQSAQSFTPILQDNDWIALRGICDS